MRFISRLFSNRNENRSIMKLNQRKAGAALSYISMGLGYLVSILYTPIMLRLLGQSEYGLYNLVGSVVAYLGLLNFGFGSTYMRYYSRYKVREDGDKIATLNGMFLIIFSGLGLLAMVAGSILAANAGTIFGAKLTAVELDRAKILMLILVVNLGISFPSIVFSSHITANEKFVFQKLVAMIRTVVNPFVVLPVLLLGYGSVGMVVITTVLNVTIEVIYAVYCLRKLEMRFSFRNFDFPLMREMTVFSSYIFINLIVDQINWNIGKFLLGRFHGTVMVAIYGLAAQLNTYYLRISTNISHVFIPQLHQMVAEANDNMKLTHLFTRIGRVQFIILSLICSSLIFFGRPFINFWAGPNYDEAYPIALLLIIPGTVSLTQNIGIEIQRAKNMHQFRSWLYLILAIGNLLLSIPLSRLYGGVGAAIGTAISIFVGNGLLMNWYYHAKVGLDMHYFWREILRFSPAFIAPTAVGILSNHFLDTTNKWIFLISAFFYVLVFCLSMWQWGMNSYEKDLISKPIIRLLKLRKR